MTNYDFDKLLEETIEEIVCEQYGEIEEYIEIQGAHVFSEVFERKMDKILGKKKIVENNTDFSYGKEKMCRKPKWRYVLVAVLLLGMCTMTVLAVEPIREKVRNIIYTVFPDHLLLEKSTESIVESSTVKDVTTIEWKKPTYIPEGYVLIDEYKDEIVQEYRLTYESREGKILRYYQYHSDTKMVVTSDGKTVKEVFIDDNVAKLTIDESGTIVIFYNDKQWIFMLTGEEDEEEMIKILESIN